MNYKTSDFLIDNFQVIENISGFLKIIYRKLKKALLYITEVEYYFYLINILHSLTIAILIVYLGFLSILLLMKFTENQIGIKYFTILTKSMSPTISPGSLVFSEINSNYKKGDIILYEEKTKQGVPTGKYLTHRIIGINNDGSYMAKGDSNSDPDPNSVNRNQIKGKVIFVIPIVGYLDALIRTIPGFLVFVFFPFSVVIYDQMREIKKFFNRL